jgi:hypothetical protein
MDVSSKNNNNTNNTNNTNNANNTNNTTAVSNARSEALNKFFITLIIFCILSYLAYYIYKTEDIYGNNFIKGRIINSTCIKDYNNRYDCNIDLLYNIDNNEYVGKNHTNSNTYYIPGSIIDLRYNKYDKKDITTNTDTNSFKAGIIMFFGLLLLLLSLKYLYNVFTSNTVPVTNPIIYDTYNTNTTTFGINGYSFSFGNSNIPTIRI